jgi:hypothetical protein
MSTPNRPGGRPKLPWDDAEPDLASTSIYDPSRRSAPPSVPAEDLARTSIYDPSRRSAPAAVDNGQTLMTDMLEDQTRFGGDIPLGTVMLDAGAPASQPGGGGPPISGQPIVGAPLPADAAEWMRFGRVISSTIERAIASGEADLALRAAMSRAWAAWQLGNYGNRQIAQVARLVETTWKALRDTTREDRDAVVRDCATILSNGLPRDMRTWMPQERIVAAVDALAREPDLQAARLEGVARLLGWTDAAKAWGAEAIAIAVGEHR